MTLQCSSPTVPPRLEASAGVVVEMAQPFLAHPGKRGLAGAAEECGERGADNAENGGERRGRDQPS